MLRRRIAAAALVAAAAFLLVWFTRPAAPPPLVQLTGPTMGSTYAISYHGKGAPDAAQMQREVQAILDEVDAAVSTYRSDSVALTDTVTTPYSMDGKYLGDQEISSGSTQKHPTYTTYYASKQDILWCIFETDGAVTAQPLVTDPRWDVPILLSESETVMAYDSAANSYYEMTPDPEVYDIRVVDRIDAAFLDELTEGEVAGL